MKIVWLFLLLIGVGCSAQTATDTTQKADSAFIYLSGIYKTYNPAKAFTLFMQRAINGEAKAMNAVGLQYAKGLGVDSNFNAAIYWLKQAADNGYTKAYVNIGMLYKHRLADSADLDIACHYFDTAITLGDTSAWFAKGYMLYKGLGCNQDYTAALALFKNAALEGRADAMYFAGLCFKNGYGVAANADSATYYINQSATKGYRNALAEIAVARATDSTGSTAGARSTNKNKLNKTMPSLPKIATTEIRDADISYKTIVAQTLPNLSGLYEGTLLQYDYSGKKILKQTKLKLNLYNFANKLQGDWIEDDSIYLPLNASQSAKGLVFENMKYSIEKIKTKYLKTKTSKAIIFKSARLNAVQKGDSLYLCGNLILFNNYSNEPDKPIYLQLLQIQKGGIPIAIYKQNNIVNPIKF